MRRGEVWWAEMGGGAGRRPVVLLSRDEAYALRAFVTIAPVTSRIRNIPAEVTLGPADGLARPCVANLDSMTTIAMDRLRDYVTSLSSSKIAAIDAAIHFALGLTT